MADTHKVFTFRAVLQVILVVFAAPLISLTIKEFARKTRYRLLPGVW